ncbi:acyl--CoA ligase [Parasphingopyxis algicola]|nr:acyl--CoA ligase [Parasphingopyxis algicola]
MPFRRPGDDEPRRGHERNAVTAKMTPEERSRTYRERGWWQGISVDSLLRDAVAARGGEEALIDPPNRPDLTGTEPARLSFADIDIRVDSFCRAFAALGLKPGDVIVTQLPNIVEGVIAFLACARFGTILSPAAMAYRRHELGKIVGQVDPKLILTVETFHGFDHRAEIADMLDADGRDVPVLALGSGGEDSDRSFEWHEARAADSETPRREAEASEILTICWTSGTEADPKGVPRHHDHWTVNGEAMIEAADLQSGAAILNPFPLINIAAIGGMVIPWLMVQGKLVQHHPFDLPVFLRQMAEEKISYTVAPPAILNMLLKQDQLLETIDLSNLRCMGSGSAPLAIWMVEGWQERGVPVMNVFGSNEGCSLFSTHAEMPDAHLRASYFPRFGAKGVEWKSAFPNKIRTRLVDPDTEEEITKAGKAGELRIDGAMTFDGYWNAEELNASAFDDQGYFRTGDLFEIAPDDARFYQFVGRSKEVIIRGGVNISPAELDGLIESHPKVREAACAAYPDERLGEKICAVVALAEGETLELEELTAHLQDVGISVYKLPEKLRTVESLPRNPLGKVLRRELAGVAAS